MYCKPGQERISIYKCSFPHIAILSGVQPTLMFFHSPERQIERMLDSQPLARDCFLLCKEPKISHVENSSHKDKLISKKLPRGSKPLGGGCHSNL